jgi:hypothetical protein
LRTPRDLAGGLDVMCQVLLRVRQEYTMLLQERIDFHAGLETKQTANLLSDNGAPKRDSVLNAAGSFSGTRSIQISMSLV